MVPRRLLHLHTLHPLNFKSWKIHLDEFRPPAHPLALLGYGGKDLTEEMVGPFDSAVGEQIKSAHHGSKVVVKRKDWARLLVTTV